MIKKKNQINTHVAMGARADVKASANGRCTDSFGGGSWLLVCTTVTAGSCHGHVALEA